MTSQSAERAVVIEARGPVRLDDMNLSAAEFRICL
jgi:hypothetical protein